MSTNSNNSGRRLRYSAEDKANFYIISTPYAKNEHTGRACVKLREAYRQDRDFLIQQQVNGVYVKKVVPRKWVLDEVRNPIHMRICKGCGKSGFGLVSRTGACAAFESVKA